MITICTIGRTGSTLLMNTLNQFNDISICGELYGTNFFNRIMNNEVIYYKHLRGRGYPKHHLVGQLTNTSHPFHVTNDSVFYLYNKDEIDDILSKMNSAKERLEFMLPDNKVRGCKMLTQGMFILEMLQSYELKEMKFILLIREASAVMASMKRAGFKKYNINKVKEQNKLYKEINEYYSERTFLINYKDVINNNDNLKELFRFIEVEYNNELVERGLSIICSYGSQYNKYKKKRKLYKYDQEGRKKEV